MSRDGIRASTYKTKAVKNFPIPKNVKEVRSFLGLASIYRRLVPKFAHIAKPMSELLLLWSERQQPAFEALKNALCSKKVLAYPNFDSQFILTTDTSKTTVAAILSQVQDDVERPICFASRQLNTAESRYSASELKILAVTWATRHFRCYFYGKQFVMRTDHAALTYMHNFAGNNSRLLHWLLRLSEFDFVVEYRPRYTD